MNRYTLTYFDVRGRAEPIRLLLSYAGVPFEDKGITNQWPEMKSETPLGQLPFLVEHRPDGDRTIPQSMAIMRHLARVHGVDGATEDERVAADVAAETALDFKAGFAALRFSPGWRDDAAKAKYVKETAPAHIARLAKLLGDREWFAGKAPTWGDLVVYDVLSSHVATWSDILADSPKLAAFHTRVESLEKLKPYLAKRRSA